MNDLGAKKWGSPKPRHLKPGHLKKKVLLSAWGRLDGACFPSLDGGFPFKRVPSNTRQNYEQKLAVKLSNLPCFAAFGVIFCLEFRSHFCQIPFADVPL